MRHALHTIHVGGLSHGIEEAKKALQVVDAYKETLYALAAERTSAHSHLEWF